MTVYFGTVLCRHSFNSTWNLKKEEKKTRPWELVGGYFLVINKEGVLMVNVALPTLCCRLNCGIGNCTGILMHNSYEKTQTAFFFPCDRLGLLCACAQLNSKSLLV